MDALAPCGTQPFFKTIVENTSMGAEAGLFVGAISSIHNLYQRQLITTLFFNSQLGFIDSLILASETAILVLDKTLVAAALGGGLGLLAGTARATSQLLLCYFFSTHKA